MSHSKAQANSASRNVEYRIVRPDGAVRHIREPGCPILDDEARAMLVSSVGLGKDRTAVLGIGLRRRHVRPY